VILTRGSIEETREEEEGERRELGEVIYLYRSKGSGVRLVIY
jgi:hypothetical protein